MAIYSRSLDLYTSHSLRILYELENESQYSYAGNFCQTSSAVSFSLDDIYNLITGSDYGGSETGEPGPPDINPTGMVSCSYYDGYTGSIWCIANNKNYIPFSSSDNHINVIKEASDQYKYSPDTIQFYPKFFEDSSFDPIYKYKFIGNEVCQILGLPSNTWIYTSKGILGAKSGSRDGDTFNIKGDIHANNLTIYDNINIADTCLWDGNVNYFCDARNKYVNKNKGITWYVTGSDNNGYYWMSYNKTSKLVEGKFGSLDIIGDIHTNGNIIAENYIISSSVTHMTTSFSSGSTIFGDTLDDTHQFTGSIYVTGSLEVNGDISSSGDIYLEDTKGLYFTGNGRGTISGSLLNIKLNGSYGFLIYSGSDITFKIDNNNNGNIGIGTGYTTDAKLTVNGDISASGDFYSNGQNITGSGGWHGSQERIKILPTDFMGEGRTQYLDGSRGSVPFYLNAAVEGSNDGGAVMNKTDTDDLFCSVVIPMGYKATDVMIYDESDNRPITVYESDIDSVTSTSMGTGNANTEFSITDTTATTTNYLVIKYDVQATNDRIFGGYIIIERV